MTRKMTENERKANLAVIAFMARLPPDFLQEHERDLLVTALISALDGYENEPVEVNIGSFLAGWCSRNEQLNNAWAAMTPGRN